tara:strand:+ start:4530 stop:4766 length:237 start_codon:yes stop_codon:yes gene_type:complete
MPIVYIEKDVLDLMIDCLIECGHEEKVIDFIVVSSDSDSDSDDENIIIEKNEAQVPASKVEDKAKSLQLKRGRVLDTE